jgi:tellurium resistance protein TerZ
MAIDLKKGNKISLEKAGLPLQQVSIGLNWGAIQKKMLFGLWTDQEAVDLDGSVVTFDREGQSLEAVYYRKLRSADGAIRHSGDDREGDTTKPDDLDNEVIQIDLTRVDPQVQQVFLFLNSYKGQDFATIPYSRVRVYEGFGIGGEPRKVFATFNLSAEAAYAGHISMLLGKLVRHEANWQFQALGEAVEAKGINATIAVIKAKYLGGLYA